MPKLPTPRSSMLLSHGKVTLIQSPRLVPRPTPTASYPASSSGLLRRLTTWTPPAAQPAAADVADAATTPQRPQGPSSSSSAAATASDQVYPILDKHREAFRDPATGRPLSAFQWRVYDAIFTDLPAGETTTYGALAAQLNSSARAVGSALAKNPFAPAVPCHRVVGAGGRMAGFKGETTGERILEKVALLQAEGVFVVERKTGEWAVGPRPFVAPGTRGAV